MRDPKSRLWLLIVLVGTIVQIGCVLFLSARGTNYPDEGSYWDLAGSLREGRGLTLSSDAFSGLIVAGEPTAYFGALFPVFVAALRSITSDHLIASRMILGVASWIAMAYGLRRVCRNEQLPVVGIVSVAFLAIYPPLHFLFSFLMTETILVPMVVWMVVAGQSVRRSPGVRSGTILGLLYGLIHLIKVNLLPFQLLHVLLVLRGTPRRTAIRTAATCLGITAILLAPWAIRNYRCYGEICLETKSGFNLWLMNNPRHTEPFWKEEFASGVDMPDFSGRNEYERSAVCRERFMEFARTHPDRFMELCAARFLNTWPTLPVYMSLPNFVKWPIRLGMAIVYVALIWGVFLAVRRRKLLTPVLLVLYAAGACALTNGAIRHRAYAEPFIVLLAAYPFADRFIKPREELLEKSRVPGN